MGSTLSIYNDTGSTVYVKVGNDKKALRIATIVGASVALIGSVVILGLGAVAAATITGEAIVVSSTLLTGITVAVASEATLLTVIEKLKEEIGNNGYTMLTSGQTYQTEKKALLSWQQCHVIRVTHHGQNVIIEETYMRPIFTGATGGSNIRHDISYWVNRYPWSVTFNLPVQIRGTPASNSTASHHHSFMARTQFPPGSYVFTSYHGTHLRAWPGRTNEHSRTNLTENNDAWEKWTPIHLGGNQYAWKSIAHGRYLSANSNGSVTVSPWLHECEKWTHMQGSGGNVWCSCHGTYLRANSDLTVDLVSHAREGEWCEWELLN